MRNRADFFKALGEETRLRILEIVAEEELCNCQIRRAPCVTIVVVGTK